MRIALVGKYVQLHDAYLSVTEALKHAASTTASSSRSTGWTPRRPTSGAPRRGRRHPGAGRLRRARHRGQDRGRPLRPRARRAVPRDLPRHADRRDRVGPPRVRHGRRQLERVRPRDAVPGHRPPPRAAADRGAGRHDAPGRRPRPPRAGDAARARRTREQTVIYERHRHRYEVNPALRAELEEAGLVRQRHVARRPPGRDRRAARPPVVLRVASSTPSSRAGPPGRSRSSASSSGAAAARAPASPAPERAPLGG